MAGSYSIKPRYWTRAFLQVSSLEGEVGLTPLLQGKIEVTRIRLRDFQLNLEALGKGVNNWDIASPFLSADPGKDDFIELKRFEKPYRKLKLSFRQPATNRSNSDATGGEIHVAA